MDHLRVSIVAWENTSGFLAGCNEFTHEAFFRINEAAEEFILNKWKASNTYPTIKRGLLISFVTIEGDLYEPLVRLFEVPEDVLSDEEFLPSDSDEEEKTIDAEKEEEVKQPNKKMKREENSIEFDPNDPMIVEEELEYLETTSDEEEECDGFCVHKDQFGKF